MNSTENRLIISDNNKFLKIWLAVLLSFIAGYSALIVVMYLYQEDLFKFLSEELFTFLITSVIVITLIVLLARVLMAHQINNRWVRLLLCIFIPLVWGLISVIVFGNEQIAGSELMTMLDKHQRIFTVCVAVTPIVLGQILIKPWKNVYCFIGGAAYAAFLYIFQIIYQLILTGYIYDDWV
jgi:DNA integrity scanning protein DisA with diadenylate cyclase activity